MRWLQTISSRQTRLRAQHREPRARRWEVSEAELEQMAAARSAPLDARTALTLLARSPRLASDVARVLGGALRSVIFDNNPLVSMLDAERARRAVAGRSHGGRLGR